MLGLDPSIPVCALPPDCRVKPVNDKGVFPKSAVSGLRNLTRRVAAFSLVLALAAACSPQRTYEAWALLDDLNAGPGPSALKDSTPAPTRRQIAYGPTRSGFYGDLYEPRSEQAGVPLVLVPGAAPGGKDDPRLVAVAETFARSGFTVLVPDIENLRRLNVSADDAQHIAAAVQRVARATGQEGEPAVGIMAVSYAAGPAVIAATETPAGESVAFILSVGGYYDMEAVITFFTTGNYRNAPEGAWRYRAPNEYGKWVFLRSNAARMPEWRDRVLLDAIADRKIYDPAADVGQLVGRLGPDGRAVMDLLSNRDPERVGALIRALPAALRDEIFALDLKRLDLSRVGFQVILLHGSKDPIIPSTESRALARALPEEKAHLYVLEGLEHVELRPKGFSDRLMFLRAATRLLEIRDSISARSE